ncbi:MAG TPA: pseudouridine synthase, partial [Rhodobacteraceae bacterium]|nr:pseudouridine synthase [Paracoccaceae bacterium]
KIAHPKFKAEKTYWVQIEGIISKEALCSLRNGIILKDGKTLPAKAVAIPRPTNLWERSPPIRVRKSIPDSWIELKLMEGRNRQVRRMTAHVGFPTLRLIRVQIGHWGLAGLASGSWRKE